MIALLMIMLGWSLPHAMEVVTFVMGTMLVLRSMCQVLYAALQLDPLARLKQPQRLPRPPDPPPQRVFPVHTLLSGEPCACRECKLPTSAPAAVRPNTTTKREIHAY
jgi:hypothetical protein